MPHALMKTVISAVNVTLDLVVMVSHVLMSTSVITHHVMLTLPVQMNSVHFHVLVTLDSVEWNDKLEHIQVNDDSHISRDIWMIDNMT